MLLYEVCSAIPEGLDCHGIRGRGGMRDSATDPYAGILRQCFAQLVGCFRRRKAVLQSRGALWIKVSHPSSWLAALKETAPAFGHPLIAQEDAQSLGFL